MRTKKFNLKKALAGNKMITIDGQKVISFTARNEGSDKYPYSVITKNNNYTVTTEGSYWSNTANSILDLRMLIKKKIKKEEYLPDIDIKFNKMVDAVNKCFNAYKQ